jgi:hypothetical protein
MEIPAISFIRIGNSLIDDNYLDNADMQKILENNKMKNKKKLSYHQILNKMYQILKNR